LLHGDYPHIFRGFGLDLADLRDTVSRRRTHIDGTSRRACRRRTCAKYHEDRELAPWFLVDLSHSVDFGSGEVRKRSVAVVSLPLLARV